MYATGQWAIPCSPDLLTNHPIMRIGIDVGGTFVRVAAHLPSPNPLPAMPADPLADIRLAAELTTPIETTHQTAGHP